MSAASVSPRQTKFLVETLQFSLSSNSDLMFNERYNKRLHKVKTSNNNAVHYRNTETPCSEKKLPAYYFVTFSE